MIFKDYYKILGLIDNKVTKEDIRAAFREQAKKYHPDINGGRASEERFKDINESYRVLTNPSSRRKYDRMWLTHVNKKQKKYEESKRDKDSLFSDFFNMFFGVTDTQEAEENINKKENKKIAIKGDNVTTEINITIEEAYYGLEKKISLRTINGKMKTFTIKIPAGIRDGEKIRLIGQGKTGQNGGKNGDLFIKINIQNNNTFKLEGCDILTDLYLTPWEAALGKRVNVNSVEDAVSLYIPPGIRKWWKNKNT